ncbi:phage portal protein [Bacillus mycoides]|nr:phage portal protein [Bacillus mycoides]
MPLLEMVTIQKGGVLRWQKIKTKKKKKQNKQQNQPETGNPKLDGPNFPAT